MSTELTQTKDYLLFIDEEAEVCRGQHRFLNNEVELIHEGHNYPYKGNKVIAYYPLTKEAKELDLPLLPPFEVNIDKIALDWFVKVDKRDIIFDLGWMKIFEAGYKAAQSKQFSLEDMKKAIDLTQQICDRNAHYVQRDRNVHVPMITIDEEEEIIQSISTQQLPKEFVPDYEIKYKHNINSPLGDYKRELKTIINSEDKEELVGTYKY